MTASLLILLVKATIILVAALGITIAMQRASATRGLAGNSSFNPWPWPWPRPRPFP